MKAKNALPCPFCGKLPLAITIYNDNWVVFCPSSECMQNRVEVQHVTKQKTIELWNFRAKRGY